jgi:hypothetical protein
MSRPSICDESGIPAEKWVNWFPYYRDVLVNATSYCFQQLHDHPAAWTFDGDANPIGSTCPNVYDLITCVQSSLPEIVKLNNASAGVLLGLTPTILSILAPSVGELSLLSSNRPVLSFLLSLGSPAVFAIRALDYDNPLDSIKERQDPVSKPSLFAQKRVECQGRREAAISSCQYLLALACIVNVVWLSWQVGLQTIVSWKAGFSCLIFLWSSFAAAAHLTAATGWHLSRTMRTVCQKSRKEKPYASHLSGWTQFLKEEVTICAAKRRHNYLACEQQEGVIPLFLNLAAAVMGVVLLIFGTATFSSLLFISMVDATTVVARYLASALVCRFILMFELSGMAAVEVNRDIGGDSPERMVIRADVKHAATI